MHKVRSISGDWLRLTAKQHYPNLKRGAQVEALAAALQVGRRSMYAYLDGERRVTESVEQRFVALFGQPPAEGYREWTVLVDRTKKREDKPGPHRTNKPGRSSESIAAYRENWRINAITQANVFSQLVFNHRLADWTQGTITKGQVRMIELGIEEDEALRRFPENFYQLEDGEDWATYCLKCGLPGSLDDVNQEVNGLIFRVTCLSGSHLIGAKE